MKVPVPETIPALADLGAVHFIGIGGAGLSAIARLMLARGVKVSGSDGADSPVLDALREAGAQVHLGHRAEQVLGADTVVVSTAAHEDNPEYLEALRLGLVVLPRSAGLAAVMQGHRVVAVAGTHGKTTTTSLLTVALQGAGADPTYAIGGELSATGVNAGGAGDVFVAEADESDGAFLVYEPEIAVVTNVDADHLDQWGSEEAYREAFASFVQRVTSGGTLVVCVDDAHAAALEPVALGRGLRFVGVGLSGGAALRATEVELVGTTSAFTVVREGEVLGRVGLRIPGEHYVRDALAALAVGLDLGFDFDALRGGLESYTGTKRRMELKGESAGGVRVYDSYAHHPSEIAADLAAARSVAGEGRLIVAFQPHLVSRTRIFGAAMGVALGEADEVVLLPLYVSREEPDPTVSSQLVADAVTLPASLVHVVDGHEQAADALTRIATSGDLVLTLGAGDVTTLGPLLLSRLPA